jgi:hypothetical protein
MARCEDFPACGHQIGECRSDGGEGIVGVDAAQRCPECHRTFVPCSEAELMCYRCGQTPTFNSPEERDDWEREQDFE